jgi:myo-inositol-hexaphosphate 3-phosphohydrolase
MKKIKPFIFLLAAFSIINGCSDSSSDKKPLSENSLLINEFKSNIPEDLHSFQYIELRGEKNYTIENVYLAVIDGDEKEVGVVDYCLDLNGVKTGANGLLLIKNIEEYNDLVDSETAVINETLIKTYDDEDHEDGILEHDAITYALIKTKALIKAGDDIDTDNDGKIDLPLEYEIIDSVGNYNGGDGVLYTNAVLTQSASDPDAATRFFNDLTPNSAGAWANGDIYEDPEKSDERELAAEVLYDTLEASSNLPPNARLTPGSHNFKKAPFVVLNEIVSSDNKYIELLSNSSQSLDFVYLAVISGENNNSSLIDLSGKQAKSSGITVVKDLSAVIVRHLETEITEGDLSLLSPDKSSILLVYSAEPISSDFKFIEGETLKLPENSVLLDSIGWGDNCYLDLKIVKDYKIDGATRYKDNRMASKSAWTYGSLAGCDYIPGSSKNLPANGFVTPCEINISEETSMLVKPAVETARSTIQSPDADDMAFWIHPSDPEKSMVIATQKNAGYSIYDVSGNTLLDNLPDTNRFNNVDVIYGIDLNGTQTDIALFTDRNTNKFAIYKITESSPYIIDITDPENSDELFDAEEPGEDTAYGEGVYKSPVTGKVYAFATQNGTWNTAQFELVVNQDKIGWKKIRTITLEADDDDEHAEGIVIDQEYGKAYIAQEGVGVYVMDAEPGAEPLDISLDENDLIAEEGDFNLKKDLEGMTIYYKGDKTGYVFVSSQGNNTYAVFDRTPNGVKNNYIKPFAIVDNMEGIDGTQHTDSIDVTNMSVGSKFPNGAFIAQDGTDTSDTIGDTGTNFKWVKWEEIGTGLGDIDFSSNYNPRNPVNRR